MVHLVKVDTVIGTERRRIPVEILSLYMYTSLFVTLVWIMSAPAQSVAQVLVRTVPLLLG